MPTSSFRGLHGFFEDQVTRTPEAVALRFGSHSLSYAQLEAHANLVAQHLRSIGVGPEVPVGLCLPRSPDLVVGLLGILKAGGAYVPLDPAYPSDRLAFILQDVQAPLLITQRSCCPELAPFSGRCLFLDEIVADTEPIAAPPPVVIGPETLAYIIYTSGSTGTPKGVMVEHGNANALIEWTCEEFSADELAVTLFSTSVCFDLSVFELFAPLAQGGCVRIVDNALALVDHPWAGDVTLLNTIPSVAAELLQQGCLPKSVESINLAGEPLLQPLVDDLYARSSVRRVRDLYGPSETTVYSTCAHRVSGGPNTIGHPIAGTQIHLLDASRQTIPPGSTGEIYIGGAGVARGYYARPDLTAERFLPDPCQPRPGARYYRTGDLARFLPDGTLEYIGRIDHQLKIRGFRVEPGEVEGALARHPALHHAVVIGREDRHGDKQLVAYVVPKPGLAAPTPAQLKSFLKATLPDHLLPAASVVLDRLPLAPNGKLDRSALPDPDDGATRCSAVHTPASTPAESLLLEIWSAVLGRPSLGIHDHFFEIGGHSLRALQVTSRAARAFGRAVPMRLLFEHPTVATLAAALEEKTHDQRQDSRLAPVVRADGRDMPASFGQESLWFLDHLESERDAYNLGFAWRIRGPLDPEALRRTLEHALRRHEPLRTNLSMIDGRTVQRIQSLHTWELPQTDLRSMPEELRDAEIDRHSERAFTQPFDLAHGLMLRASLLRVSDAEHLFLLTLHHIAVDGWSLPLLWRELATGYEAACAGREPEFPQLPARYVDFAVWQRRQLDGDRLAALLSYWRQNLAGLEPLQLPTDHPRPSERSSRGGRRTLALDAALVQSLRTLGLAAGTTLNMTLLAAFEVLIARWTGQHDIAVGTPVSERRQSNLEELVGFFINTLVLRTSLDGNPSFRDLLGRVRTTCLGAYEHHDLPFKKLVETLRPDRDSGRIPLVSVIFQYLDLPDTDLSLGHLALERQTPPATSVRFDLEMHLWGEGNGIRGELLYASDLFTSATIDRLAGHWEMLLRGIVADPDCRIDSLPLLTPEERQMILVDWNDTAVEYPRDLPLPRIFESVVDRFSDAIALVADHRTTTYRALDDRANQLAHHLRAIGVVPGMFVGVDLPRSVEFVVAVLAILKTGSAYVPFGREYPPERRRAIARDAGIRAVICGGATSRIWIDQSITIVNLNQDADSIAAAPATRLPTLASAGDPAYVMYTSGSTGHPKGVLIPHRGIARLVLGSDFLPWGSDLRFLLLATPAFDASTLEIWGPLLHGATLVVYAEEDLDLTTLRTILAQEKVTCLWLTAALFNHIVDEAPLILTPVRQLMTGGEQLSKRHVLAALDLLPGVRLINGYGPTETTTFATTHEIRREEFRVAHSSIPIGRPIANTRCLVLDRHGQLVPIGVPGELHIGGDGVGLGYVGDAERTAEKFVVLPFGGHPGDRWYRTGDLVRWRPDGSLDYLGRIDRQVKIRGFRIEPAEVEAALSQHPAIAEVIVVMREDDPGDKHLVAYLVAKPATAVPTHADIRQFLQPMLPDHMIPAAFVALPVLPLTSNGKLDHAALPLHPQEVSRGDPPRGPDEELVARVFRELLHRTDVDRQADFFHLGGDSLQALDAVTRISSEGNVSLRVTDLIRRPTIEGLAAAVSALRTGTTPTVPPPSSTPATTRPAPFVRRLREIASRHPQRRALISRSGTIAFQELHIRSNRLANHLLGLGMKPGERVRLGAGVSPDTLTAMLALLKVGVTIELGEFSSPAWVILDSPSDLASEHTGQAPRFDTSPEHIRKMTGERCLMLDELIHAGSVEWRVMPSSLECPPLKAAGRDLAFRGFRRGDLVTYGEIERLAAKTRPGLPLFDIVGQEATPRRLLRRILQGRTLVAVGSVPPSDSSGASAGPQDRDTHRGRDVLAGCLATIGSAVRGAGERLFSVADRDFLTIKRRGHDGPIIACIGDTRPIADILRLSPPTAEVLSLGLDGIQVWPPRGYSVQEHVDCYLRILRHRPLHLGVLLVGFSQGGAICHALACALESLRNGGNLSKSEFTRPSHGLVNRALRAWLSHDRSDGRPPYAERVELMQDTLTEIRREHSWKVLSGSATLIGGRVWMADQGAAWRGLCSGALQQVPLDTDDHFAAFRDPASIAHWHLTLNAAYAGLEADGAKTVRCLLIEPSSPQEN